MNDDVKITIVDLVRTANDNVVVNVTWKATILKDGMFESATQETKLPYKSPEDSGFITFEKLSKDIVIEWIKKQKTFEIAVKNLVEKIERRKEPKYVNGFPWGE
jgi:hypothetical protein